MHLNNINVMAHCGYYTHKHMCDAHASIVGNGANGTAHTGCAITRHFSLLSSPISRKFGHAIGAHQRQAAEQLVALVRR